MASEEAHFGAQSSGRAAPRSFEPIGQLIARHLREEILHGNLRPGAHIRQAPVAEKFGTSRIPVREALAQLESEGLVSLVPHAGARVARFDFGEHIELYLIREQLEPLAIAESCSRIDAEQLEGLRRQARLIEEQAADERTWLTTDRDFHLATYAPAEMPQLLDMIDSLWNQTTHYRRIFRRLINETARQIELGFDEHRLIIDALSRRDQSTTAELVRMHLRRTRLRITEHAAELDADATGGAWQPVDPAGERDAQLDHGVRGRRSG